ncbi:MAG: hypothetical protein J6U01_05020 [Clostridia bacterium]|nr:hypothetical protein [Clostridia bacterium]
MTASAVPCVRCLLSELPDEKALAEILRERLAQLSPEERVPEAVRQRRLDVCRACGRLNRGTCTACGCYVELRAARRGRSCPEGPEKWEKG